MNLKKIAFFMLLLAVLSHLASILPGLTCPSLIGSAQACDTPDPGNEDHYE